MSSNKSVNNNMRLVKRLLLGVVGMFAFGFLLVPLYDVICDITGLNGKTGDQYALDESGEIRVDEEREVSVQFVTRSNDIGWEFRPTQRQMTVKPGEIHVVSYTVTNNTDRHMIGQAIPSVAPNAAAAHLNKIECFCFDEQPLAPGESAEMPLRFFVNPELSSRVSTLTLAYTLYDITESPRRARELAANP